VQEDVAKRPAARARSSGKGEDKARTSKRRREGPLTGAYLHVRYCTLYLLHNSGLNSSNVVAPM
jgi:hypothetical protein